MYFQAVLCHSTPIYGELHEKMGMAALGMLASNMGW